ncbi:EscU/YscU/HrcU family type III secretion system export apparatus switch protein [Vallitalea okinawensis]|uniref:EscU/YscU/HrcU family type III secretion system export apparatus switch protein n=1 Tax=Vallitalea okinawensis TaxID=2078660 RepID=UPI000CFD742F|nr:EscU/YscU/HrcU family type III secretion system export apparatus switch protein [Vallitalea okinawensis]
MKKHKKAVAIQYDPNISYAPAVLAKGKGIVAENILETAEKSNVPIYEDKKLTDELIKLDIGNEIPKELYQVVAEILVFVNDLDELEGRINESKQEG